MTNRERIERQFGAIRDIQNERARRCLMELASDCFHKRLDKHTLQTGALINLLAEIIIDIEYGRVIPRTFADDFDGDVISAVKLEGGGKEKNENPYEDLSEYGDGYEEIYKRFV